uniref:C2H2-type domain-containing protein n=1 Tax=Oryzias melastigma TaxID=30732 RepID=A0A3B3CBC9_ORYME
MEGRDYSTMMHRGSAVRMEAFRHQAELILHAAVEAAVSELLRSEPAGVREGSEARLVAVLDAMSRVALRQICRVFLELQASVEAENKALKDRLRRLEGHTPSMQSVSSDPKTALHRSDPARELSEEQQKEQERRRRRELYKEKRFFCELCSKGFHQHHQLLKHGSSHHKPFPCSSCDKGFYGEPALRRHKVSHQVRAAQESDPDRMLCCDICDRKFRLLRQLRAHQASHRLQRDPLKCDTCDRTFTSKSALRYHSVSHAKVKPFICDVCGKSFIRKKSLAEHQSVHSGVRPYACQTCGKRFSTTGNLRVHKRAHSEERPYKCDQCDKAFKFKMGLLHHQVVHSGEKPFTCQVCGVNFGLKYNLQRHMRLHSGEKPYRYVCRLLFLQLLGWDRGSPVTPLTCPPVLPSGVTSAVKVFLVPGL